MLSTALRIVDEKGVDALTMRGLATALNTGTATLYRHFDSRTDLLAQVSDILYGELLINFEDLTDWRDALRTSAQDIFAVLARHRGAARLLLESAPRGPHAMVRRERTLTNLLSNGFSAALAASTFATFARYVLGFAIQLSDQVSSSVQSQQGTLGSFSDVDGTAFPTTLALADHLPVKLDEEFCFGLNLMIAGLSAMREEEKALRVRKTRP